MLVLGIVVVPILTIEVDVKSVPVTVTIVPAYPSEGEKEETVGVTIAAPMVVSVFTSNSFEKEETPTNRHSAIITD